MEDANHSVCERAGVLSTLSALGPRGALTPLKKKKEVKKKKCVISSRRFPQPGTFFARSLGLEETLAT